MRFDDCEPGLEVQRRARHPYLVEFNPFPTAASASSCPVNTWVQLTELPSPFSHDEALLLCQHSEDRWLAWIPDFGEAILNINQFQFAS